MEIFSFNNPEFNPEPEVESEPVIDRGAVIEKLYGLDKDVSFNATLEKIAHTFTDAEKQEMSGFLREHGIAAPAEACPKHFLALCENFSPEDWNRIKDSKDQLLALHGTVNYFQDKRFNPEQFERRTNNESDKEAMRSLPLIHGTTFDGLMKSIQSGNLISNKDVYTASGVSAKEFMARGNATTSSDRLIGLDQYVFADFGRPHRYRQDRQSEVTVVIGQEVLDQSGAFLTDKDYLDQSGDDALEQYAESISIAPYFRESALNKIRSSFVDDRRVGARSEAATNTVWGFMSGAGDESGEFGFSTWEAKIPRVSVESIRKVVFKNKDQFDSFRQQYGDKIPCVYEPDLKDKKDRYAEIFGVNEEIERMYKKSIDAGYEERAKALADLPAEQKQTMWVQIPETDAVHPRWYGEKSNAFVQGRGAFASLSEFDMPYMTEDDFGDAPWGTYAALVEVPKADAAAHNLNAKTPSRVLEFKRVSYAEMKKAKGF